MYLLDGGAEYRETMHKAGEPAVQQTEWILNHASGRGDYTVAEIFRINLERENSVRRQCCIGMQLSNALLLVGLLMQFCAQLHPLWRLRMIQRLGGVTHPNGICWIFPQLCFPSGGIRPRRTLLVYLSHATRSRSLFMDNGNPGRMTTHRFRCNWWGAGTTRRNYWQFWMSSRRQLVQ